MGPELWANGQSSHFEAQPLPCPVSLPPSPQHCPGPVPSGPGVPTSLALLYVSQTRLRDATEHIAGLFAPSLSSLALGCSPSWCFHVPCCPSGLTSTAISSPGGVHWLVGCPPSVTHSPSLSTFCLLLWWHILLPPLCVQGTLSVRHSLARCTGAHDPLCWRTDHFWGRQGTPRRAAGWRAGGAPRSV